MLRYVLCAHEDGFSCHFPFPFSVLRRPWPPTLHTGLRLGCRKWEETRTPLRTREGRRRTPQCTTTHTTMDGRFTEVPPATRGPRRVGVGASGGRATSATPGRHLSSCVVFGTSLNLLGVWVEGRSCLFRIHWTSSCVLSDTVSLLWPWVLSPSHPWEVGRLVVGREGPRPWSRVVSAPPVEPPAHLHV